MLAEAWLALDAPDWRNSGFVPRTRGLPRLRLRACISADADDVAAHVRKGARFYSWRCCSCLQAAVRLSVVGCSPRCADRPAPAATSRCLGCVGEPASSLRCPAEIAPGGGRPWAWPSRCPQGWRESYWRRAWPAGRGLEMVR